MSLPGIRAHKRQLCRLLFSSFVSFSFLLLLSLFWTQVLFTLGSWFLPFYTSLNMNCLDTHYSSLHNTTLIHNTRLFLPGPRLTALIVLFPGSVRFKCGLVTMVTLRGGFWGGLGQVSTCKLRGVMGKLPLTGVGFPTMWLLHMFRLNYDYRFQTEQLEHFI